MAEMFVIPIWREVYINLSLRFKDQIDTKIDFKILEPSGKKTIKNSRHIVSP